MRTAKHWTTVYAGGNSKNQELEQKVKQIVEMGFDEVSTSCLLYFLPYFVSADNSVLHAC